MSLPEFDVTDQKVIVVGAGRGIGKGIALAFAEAGADIAITGLTSTGVNQVAKEIEELGRTAFPVTGDATKAADMDRIVQETLDNIIHKFFKYRIYFFNPINREFELRGI